VSFFLSIRDEKGVYASFDPRTLPLDLDAGHLAELRRTGIVYELELIVPGGTTEVSLTVADLDGRTSSTTTFKVRTPQR
jgi:hypothetical protein